jgi:hypothetical protein
LACANSSRVGPTVGSPATLASRPARSGANPGANRNYLDILYDSAYYVHGFQQGPSHGASPSIAKHQCPSCEFPVRRNNSLLPRNREFTSNLLMSRAIMGPRQPEKEQICTILNNSLLNSLLAGNRGRRKHMKVQEMSEILAGRFAGSALPLTKFHVKRSPRRRDVI